MKPRRKENGLFVQQLGDELVVFNHTTYKASSLNASAAFVFNLCDGSRTRDMLAAEVSTKQGVSVAEAEAIVDLALERFSRQGLLAESVPPARGDRLITRRKVLQHLATAAVVAAVAIPMVASLPAPSAAFSVSNGRFLLEKGAACTPGSVHNPCASGLTCYQNIDTKEYTCQPTSA